MKQATVWGFGLCLGAVLIAGCSREGGGTVKAGGTLTVKGQPMAGLNVTFMPEGGRPASGTTDASGKFTLSTFGKDDGAVPGTHKVTVVEDYTEPPPMPGTPEAAANPPKPPKFDPKYSDPDKSGLTATIKAGEDNTKINLELK